MNKNNQDAKRTVQKIKNKQYFKKLRQIVIPITSHFAGLIAIFSFKFINQGNFIFNNNLLDWSVLILMFVLTYTGFQDITRILRNNYSLTLSRAELSYFLNTAREQSVSSIISICGDLSWLNEDRTHLIGLRRGTNKPSIKIFFNRTKTTKTTKELMSELMRFGIEFLPYDNFNEKHNTNYLLIDYGTDDEKPIIMYEKITNSSTDPKTTDEFVWTESSIKDNKTLAFILKFIQIHDIASKNPIKIGICGINNVGKTTLAKYCFSRLKVIYHTKFFEDEFKNHTSTDAYTNSLILHNQISNQQFSGNKLCIFDRTSIDNYFYFFVRASMDNDVSVFPKSEEVFTDYYQDVDKNMDELDLLIYVENNSKRSIKTTYVSESIRNQIDIDLKKYIKNCEKKGKVIFKVNLDPDNLDLKLESVFKQVNEFIESTIIERNLSKIRIYQKQEDSNVINRSIYQRDRLREYMSKRR